MRRCLLDTSLLAALLNNRQSAVSLIRPRMERHEVATSILVYGEVVEYIRGFPDFAERQGALRLLLGEVYPYFLTYWLVLP